MLTMRLNLYGAVAFSLLVRGGEKTFQNVPEQDVVIRSVRVEKGK